MPSSVHIDSHRAWGGGQAQSLGLALALAARGEETWFVAEPGSELAARLRTTHLPWEAIPLRGLPGVAAIRHLARRLAQLKPDIVHVHESASHLVAGIAARRAQVPRIVVTRRTESPIRRGWLGRAKYSLYCDRLICISEAIRARCLAAGLPDSLMAVIPDSVDCRHFDPGSQQGPAPDGEPTILAVGRLAASKGYRVLLRAMGEVLRTAPEAQLLICGRGAEELALRAQTRSLELGDRVQFLGFVPDVRAVLARADVFVMPSLSEGLGVAALEAMAMAKPAVVSDVGGLPELVVHGETGVVVPAGNASALADALLDLLGDRDKARLMGEAARKRALAIFDRPRMVERVNALYEEALARWTH